MPQRPSGKSLPDKERILRGNPRRTRAYLALGSNVGDRVGFVQQAMQFLKDVPAISVKESSSLYETEPLGIGYSEWFVNAVAAIDTTLSADELLLVCKDIEKRLTSFHGKSDYEESGAFGRRRIIDVDLLFFGDEILDSDSLRVPHPTIAQRAYALVPLLEIAPDFVHPRLNRTVWQIHESLPQPEQVFLYGTRGADGEIR
jgi:2-amino-4-hydroxy-6-hydroxymethyldihydropteridine diphosphokinase